ncbi:MAG TPA: hypothetical protein VK022_01730 [Paracoccaceae bacterium]|nr:hypothetical protein [Paracoccaceae bacterium]
MAGLDDIIAAREADAEHLRQWIHEIENEDWKAVRRSNGGTIDATEETLAWLRRQLDAAVSQARLLRDGDERAFPGEDAAARGIPPSEIPG